MSDDADFAYTAAAEALNNADLAAYAAICETHLVLDWAGHDRRAARLQGLAYTDQGPDPVTAPLLIHVSHLPKLSAKHIQACKSCGCRIYWSDTRGEKPAPFDVTDEGYATRINHFSTCKTADQHRKVGAKKGRAA